MMQRLLILLFLFTNIVYCQIQTEILQSFPIQAKTIVGVDNFGAIYYIDFNNALHKSSEKGKLNYSNVQLGEITSANAFNTLKINLFYQDFNTVVLLDNRLAEIYKIDLSSIQPYRNVSHISTGYDSTLWMFNTDLQQLELYDYSKRKIRVSTLPVQSSVLDLKSDYNNAWLLTEKFLYRYNYQGSLMDKITNDGYKALFQENENVLLLKEKTLLYFNVKLNEIQTLELPNILIKQFLLANETLYIYDGEILHQFHIKIK